MALAEEGVHVSLTARGAEALERRPPRSASEPRRHRDRVAGDITTDAGREAALAACPQPDILVNNAGGPPPGDFREWDRDDWIKAIDANMLTPIELIKATVDGMMARKFGRIVNITSGAVKAPIDMLGLSNGARSGLTGFVAGVARKTVDQQRHHQRPAAGAVRHRPAARARSPKPRPPRSGITVRSVDRRARQEQSRPAASAPRGVRRACAFLCSAQAGYITGQNILLDGGAYPGTI